MEVDTPCSSGRQCPGRALSPATAVVPVIAPLVLLVLLHHLLLLVFLLLLRLLLVVLLLRLRLDHGSHPPCRPPRCPPRHPAVSRPHWSGLWHVVRTPSTTRALVEVAQAPLTASQHCCSITYN